jgi:hypothetical protein
LYPVAGRRAKALSGPGKATLPPHNPQAWQQCVTMGGEDDGSAWLASARRMSCLDLHGLHLWPGARRPGPPRPEGGAGAGPAVSWSRCDGMTSISWGLGNFTYAAPCSGLTASSGSQNPRRPAHSGPSCSPSWRCVTSRRQAAAGRRTPRARRCLAGTRTRVPSSIGTPVEPRNINRRWDELRKTAGLDWLGMARVRSGQAPAWPLVSDRSVRRDTLQGQA